MSSTNSEGAIKTFVTLRVAGDSLVPEEVSLVLRTQPTHSHLKGEKYSTGKSREIAGCTGVWIFDTDRFVYSRNWLDHIQLAFFIVGLWGSSARWEDWSEQFDSLSRILHLKTLLEQKDLTATMTLFWHGSAESAAPKLPAKLFEVLKLIPINVELDFDRDEKLGGSSKRSRVA